MNVAPVVQLWQRLPVIVRAVIIGSAVNAFGAGPTGNIHGLNVRLWPAVPWSAPLVAIYMWFFWQYLEGRWWPSSTSEARRRDHRASPLSPCVWRWSLLAGGTMMCSLAALHFVTARFDPIDYRGFYRLFATVPPLTLSVLFVTISAVAGIVEETAFRGYMQGMIERRHGFTVATIVVAVFFTLLHVASIPPLTVTRTIFILAISVVYSALVRVTGSIRPGIVIHAVGDAAGLFILWWLWLNDGLRVRAPIWIYIVESAILAAVSVWAFRKLITHGISRALPKCGDTLVSIGA